MALKLVFRKIWHKWPETLLLSPRGFDLTFWLKQQKLQTCVKQSIFITYLNFGQGFHYKEMQRWTLWRSHSFYYCFFPFPTSTLDWLSYLQNTAVLFFVLLCNELLSLTFLEYILIFLRWFPAFCWHLCIILTHKTCLTFNFMEFLFTLF